MNQPSRRLAHPRKYGAETARMAGEQAKFREGLKPPEQRAAEDKEFWIAFWRMKAGEKKKEDSMLMREVAPSSNSLLDNAESTAPPVVHQVLSESGQPLDAATREFMEARFHYDFSHVRVHTGARASDSAHAVCANAYTVGSHVVFASGQYEPSSIAGQRLLVHELAHTIQQPTFATRSPATLTVSAPGDAAELDAHRAADAVMRGVAPGDAGTPFSGSPASLASSLLRQPKAPTSKAPAHLHACNSTTEMPTINKAVAQAKQSATDAVQGLDF